MRNARRSTLAFAATLLLAACAPEDDAASAGTDDAVESGVDTEMKGMQDMDGMAHMDGGRTDMMAHLQADMERMRGMSGDSIQRMLATHRPMMANMIAQMNREMHDMDMPADPAWDATMDSLRADLAAMPEMDAAELTALMPGHHRRAIRLMDMHREMMARMQM